MLKSCLHTPNRRKILKEIRYTRQYTADSGIRIKQNLEENKFYFHVIQTVQSQYI